MRPGSRASREPRHPALNPLPASPMADPSANHELPETDEQPASACAEQFHGAKRLVVPVNATRLAWGRYDHNRNRDVGEGDIHASYSADTIATSGKIRKAFRWQA